MEEPELDTDVRKAMWNSLSKDEQFQLEDALLRFALSVGKFVKFSNPLKDMGYEEDQPS